MEGVETWEDLVVLVLEDCLWLGMQPPLIVCGVRPDGSVMALRYNITRAGDRLEGIEGLVATGDFKGDKLPTPFNIMIVDQAGNAKQLKIGVSGSEH
jgi:hypothetical protein